MPRAQVEGMGLMSEQIHVFIRVLPGLWRDVVTVNTLEDAEAYWKKHIQGRGTTAWTEFVPETKVEEFKKKGSI